MNIEIISTPLTLNVSGFSGTAIGKDYTGAAFKLMDKMWQTVKANNLKHKGLNIWVYEPNEKIFAGVELESSLQQDVGLEFRKITLERYAYCKHVGPYQLIKKTGEEMRNELKKRNLNIISPYIEIYGHWTNDENKLETELLMAIA
jgi:effector-binding domain-containing protein